ncbi:heparinase II/III family protein [Cyclobacterium sp. 1_MG-2023]|uniref:heparinase II/III domain-containing protein n=1 Tax=Cyclobacterium sp. 1_MG-2023 TaxID=3062681 RepID=UPI0026E3D9F2|nr:heparinase II/III family protein [Cyclobacterium sp. 1_MG-2023]MDO6438448.1 heparinase II/III family protein [Cyclobacterium sp. 1_MG-2023]
MKMYDYKKHCCIASALLLMLVGLSLNAQQLPSKLDNPISKTYLRNNLRKASPRLVLNKEIEENLKQKLKSDPVVQNVYKSLKNGAAAVFEKPIINLDIPLEERSQNNQLDISRDLLHRIGMLAMVYRIEKEVKVLNRINEELIAACNFPTWNPKHFLDVGEMSLGIALAVDWVGEYLPASTVKLAKNALIEKGIKPSWPENGKAPKWAYGNNNWNQVCNGGMVAAAIVVAEEEPELASKTIYRAIDGMQNALNQYGPDGVYPEGATYWRYGTSFTVVTAAMFESAFGSDFGILEYPGFKESALFRVLSDSPMGLFYNYGDCGESSGSNGDATLAWFASKTGNKTFFEKEKFLKPYDKEKKFSRLLAPALVWIAQYEEKSETTVPAAWAGNGPNPVVFFTGGEDDPNKFYFGGKGGRGNISHGNMDAGSFVFELDGVRWSVDLGKNKHYGVIERTGFNLWERCQDCERWKLINKNNFGHSTLSVNDQLHRVDGKASIVEFKDGAFPEAILDMSPVFEGQLKSATRRFKKSGPRSLLIEDDIVLSEDTDRITWQLITQADVEIVEGGAILTQDGKRLKIENLSHPEFSLSVISLSPPPFYLDLKKDNLKRLELRIPTWTIEGMDTKISVQLSGE